MGSQSWTWLSSYHYHNNKYMKLIKVIKELISSKSLASPWITLSQYLLWYGTPLKAVLSGKGAVRCSIEFTAPVPILDLWDQPEWAQRSPSILAFSEHHWERSRDEGSESGADAFLGILSVNTRCWATSKLPSSSNIQRLFLPSWS